MSQRHPSRPQSHGRAIYYKGAEDRVARPPASRIDAVEYDSWETY